MLFSSKLRESVIDDKGTGKDNSFSCILRIENLVCVNCKHQLPTRVEVINDIRNSGISFSGSVSHSHSQSFSGFEASVACQNGNLLHVQPRRLYSFQNGLCRIEPSLFPHANQTWHGC